MIFSREKQKKLDEYGRLLEEAIEDVGTIVTFPDGLYSVTYADVETESKSAGLPVREFKLTVSYVDDGRVASAKKERLTEYKKQLMAELAKMEDTLDRMV